MRTRCASTYEYTDDLTLDRIVDTFVDDLRTPGKIGSRPDDDTVAHMTLDEYIRFPRETRGERSATVAPAC